MNKDSSKPETQYDYNNPIADCEIEILGQDFTWKPNESIRETILKYKGKIFRYCYYSTIQGGLTSMYEDAGEDWRQIYSTTNEYKCTPLGKFLEYSIMKNHLCKSKF